MDEMRALHEDNKKHSDNQLSTFMDHISKISDKMVKSLNNNNCDLQHKMHTHVPARKLYTSPSAVTPKRNSTITSSNMVREVLVYPPNMSNVLNAGREVNRRSDGNSNILQSYSMDEGIIEYDEEYSLSSDLENDECSQLTWESICADTEDNYR